MTYRWSEGRSRGAPHSGTWRSGLRSGRRKRSVSSVAPGTNAELTELLSQHTSSLPCHPVRPCLRQRTTSLFPPTLLLQHPSLHPLRALLFTHGPPSLRQLILPLGLWTSPFHRRNLSLASRRGNSPISRVPSTRMSCTNAQTPPTAHPLRMCLLNSPRLALGFHHARTRSCRALHKFRLR